MQLLTFVFSGTACCHEKHITEFLQSTYTSPLKITPAANRKREKSYCGMEKTRFFLEGIKNKLRRTPFNLQQTIFFSCVPHRSLVFLTSPFPSVPLLPETSRVSAHTSEVVATSVAHTFHMLALGCCFHIPSSLHRLYPPLSTPTNTYFFMWTIGVHFITQVASRGILAESLHFPRICYHCLVSLPPRSGEAAENERSAFQTVFETLFVSVGASFPSASLELFHHVI